MLEREIRLTRSQPETGANVPAVGKTRIERERTIDQSDHGINVFAQHGQHESSHSEDARLVLTGIQRLPGEIGSPAPRCLEVIGPAV